MDNIGHYGQIWPILDKIGQHWTTSDNIGQYGQHWTTWTICTIWTMRTKLDNLANKGLEKKNDTILIKWTEIQFDKWPNRSVENCSKW